MERLPTIPTEIIVSIFEQLDAFSLIAVSKTCRFWNDLVARNALLKYNILCKRYNVVDTQFPLPTAERCNRLIAHQARLNSLRWKKAYCLSLESGQLWELFGGVYAQTCQGETALAFHRTHSVSGDMEEKLTMTPVDIRIRDFGMDPFQDLLVLVELRSSHSNGDLQWPIHFRSISTGKAHPLARQPLVFNPMTTSSSNRSNFTIQVSRNLVAIQFRPRMRSVCNELVIWDWPSGQTILHLASTETIIIDCFAFLAPYEVLIARHELDEHGPLACLDLFSLSLTEPPRHSKRFLLPDLQPNVQVLGFQCCCDPTPEPGLDTKLPFYTSLENRICVLTIRLGIQIAGMLIQEHPHTLIFFTSLLVDYPDLPPPLDSQPPLVVPWSKWGDRTRMTVWQPLPWEICAHGTRLVKRVPSKAINRWQIQLCDFNPYVQHLNESPSSPKSKASSRLVGSDEENVISNPLLFRYPILSSLPYLEITTNTLFPSLDSVMLDHENIYIVGGTQREIEILSF